jgi:hypothetical protein
MSVRDVQTEAKVWKGEVNRKLNVRTYCDCGTCQASRPEGAVAYLSGSGADGRGFSIALFDEEMVEILQGVLWEAKL